MSTQVVGVIGITTGECLSPFFPLRLSFVSYVCLALVVIVIELNVGS